jgi:uncharacterized PurR-regulated membrane protein YhhQ (DUF165 family)
MDDLIAAMFVLALSSVMLVTGQQYLSKKSEAAAATSARSPQIAVISLPAYVR